MGVPHGAGGAMQASSRRHMPRRSSSRMRRRVGGRLQPWSSVLRRAREGPLFGPCTTSALLLQPTRWKDCTWHASLVGGVGKGLFPRPAKSQGLGCRLEGTPALCAHRRACWTTAGCWRQRRARPTSASSCGRRRAQAAWGLLGFLGSRPGVAGELALAVPHIAEALMVG